MPETSPVYQSINVGVAPDFCRRRVVGSVHGWYKCFRFPMPTILAMPMLGAGHRPRVVLSHREAKIKTNLGGATFGAVRVSPILAPVHLLEAEFVDWQQVFSPRRRSGAATTLP